MVRLSVILPAFNLSSKIAANLDKVESVLKRMGLTYEIVPVDDGSSDGTSKVLRNWATEGDIEMRRPVILERNVGQGGALKAGFKASRGELVLLLDGDLVSERQRAPTLTGRRSYFFSGGKYENSRNRTNKEITEADRGNLARCP